MQVLRNCPCGCPMGIQPDREALLNTLLILMFTQTIIHAAGHATPNKLVPVRLAAEGKVYLAKLKGA